MIKQYHDGKNLFHFEPNLFYIYRTHTQTKFGLNKPATINTDHLPPRPTSTIRPTVANTVLKSSIAQWPSSDDQNELRTSSSASFLDDVRRMVNK
jgi:hypothetical protein